MDDAITTAFKPLIGIPCWGVERGHGSILSFEFGLPHLIVREPFVSTSSSPDVRRRAASRRVKPVGDWHLFIFCCHWRITTADKLLTDDESGHRQIEEAAHGLDGQKLTSVTRDVEARATTFSFDLGSTLATWPYEADQQEQWSLYLPAQQVLTYRADGYYSLGPSDENSDRQTWRAEA